MNSIQPTARKKLRRAWGLAVLTASLAFGLALAGDDTPDGLPLPPPPAVDIALLKAPATDRVPEVLFSDDSTAQGAPLPAVPLETIKSATPAPASANVPVEQVLAAVNQDAPKQATMESMLMDQLRAAMPQGSEGYLFERATLPAMANLPPAGWKVRYDFHLPPRGIGQASFTGRVVGAGGQVMRTFSGSVAIDREASGVQVTRVVHRGEGLGAGDFQVMGTRLSQLPRGALDRIDTLQGTIARQELRPGQWLTDQMVQVPQIVKQSQPVTMIVQRGPIRITAPGISRQGGALGEVIRVENIQSQRVLFARVLDNDEVQVVF